jgi:hypothetical protein
MKHLYHWKDKTMKITSKVIYVAKTMIIITIKKKTKKQTKQKKKKKPSYFK